MSLLKEERETIKEVKKVWGKELWIVNNDKYCGKLIYLNKEARSSVHKHLKKQETFYVLEGWIRLSIEGKDYMLDQFSEPKTVMPGQLHSFLGITDATIIEISTHHDDNDVYRIVESRGKNGSFAKI